MRYRATGPLIIGLLGLVLCAADKPPAANAPWPAGRRVGTNSQAKDSSRTSGRQPATKPAADRTDPAAQRRQREEAALLRRLRVCDKLAEIALQTRDEQLQRLAERLEEQARRVYEERMARPIVEKPALESDQKVLDRHMGPASPGRLSDLFSTRSPAEQKGLEAARREVRP
jgi:hypothetical protein